MSKGKGKYDNHVIIALIAILVLIPTISVLLGNNQYVSKSNAETIVKATSITMTDGGNLWDGGKLFKVVVGPSTTTNKNITCTSSDTSIATVEAISTVTNASTGEKFGECDVHPLKNGTVTVTARTTDGSNLSASKTATVVKVINVTSLNMVDNGNLYDNGKTYNVYVYPTNAANKNFTCTSSNTSIATTEMAQPGSGNYGTCDVHPINSGTVTITVRPIDGSNVSTSKTITLVKPIKVTKISIMSGPTAITSLVINAGASKSLYAALLPANITYRDVTWASSNTAVLTVTNDRETGMGDPYGLTTSEILTAARGVKQGTATLTATARDGSGVKASITVTVKDTTKPTCTTTGGSTVWYNSARTISVVCSDVGSSIYSCADGVYNDGRATVTTTHTYDMNTNMTYTYNVRDAAGNTNTCTAMVRIDKTAPLKPTINSTYSGTTVTCGTDTGGSGTNSSSCIKYCVTGSSSCTPNTSSNSGVSLPGSNSNLTKCARTVDIAGNMSETICRK